MYPTMKICCTCGTWTWTRQSSWDSDFTFKKRCKLQITGSTSFLKKEVRDCLCRPQSLVGVQFGKRVREETEFIGRLLHLPKSEGIHKDRGIDGSSLLLNTKFNYNDKGEQLGMLQLKQGTVPQRNGEDNRVPTASWGKPRSRDQDDGSFCPQNGIW